MAMEEVRVLVPAERLSEFYRWFADWSDGVLTQHTRGAQPTEVPTSGADTLAAAVAWWNSLKLAERKIWGMWIDAAPALVTAGAIVAQLGLRGPRDIPGTLSWSKRKGDKVGHAVDWRFTYDAVTNEPLYGIEDVEYAALVGKARAEAEGATR
ncbi:hypothetical protein P9139_11770 [Curtobacterium flaccumfaciens]|nr:hypothetical protein P9139_11770 [Curtobacterium flaccumfaciens]